MWSKFKESVERIIPMTFGSFVMFAIIIYLMIIVAKTVWTNYQSNKQLEVEAQGIEELESQLQYDEYQIAYFNTASFKEKQARAKLGYKAAGEVAISVPTDQPAPGDAVVIETTTQVKVPNYYLWIEYFSDSN